MHDNWIIIGHWTHIQQNSKSDANPLWYEWPASRDVLTSSENLLVHMNFFSIYKKINCNSTIKKFSSPYHNFFLKPSHFVMWNGSKKNKQAHSLLIRYTYNNMRPAHIIWMFTV